MSNSVNLSLDVTKTGIQNPLIKVRQGDGGFETLRTTVTANGEPMDLQGWTITFMGTTAGNHKIVDANVTVVEAPNGVFDYTPSKAWGMDIGEFKIAYFKFVKGDGSASSANFRVNVIEAVDLTQEEAQNYISIVDTTIAEAKEHLESSLASVSASVAATSSAVSSLSVSVSSTASSAVSQINSAASNASSVATSAVNNVSSVASSAVNNINGAADVYVKKSGTETIDGDKTFTGNVTFSGTSNIVSATARERILDGYDLNGYADTYKYIINGAKNLVNYPSSASTWATLDVDKINQNTSTQTLTDTYNQVFIRNLGGNPAKWSPWIELANDANVVHKTGNETIAGDKTFTGNIIQQTVTKTGSGNGLTWTARRVGKNVFLTIQGTTAALTASGSFISGLRVDEDMRPADIAINAMRVGSISSTVAALRIDGTLSVNSDVPARTMIYGSFSYIVA